MLYLSSLYILVKLKVGLSLLPLLSGNVLVAERRQFGCTFDDTIDLFLGLPNLPDLLLTRLLILYPATAFLLQHRLTQMLLELRFCEVITTFDTALLRPYLNWIHFFEVATKGLLYIHSCLYLLLIYPKFSNRDIVRRLNVLIWDLICGL